MADPRPRLVFDTNVIVSAALLRRSVPRLALDRGLETGLLLISAATVGELNDVLRRPSLNKYVSEDDRTLFLATLLREAELVNVTRTCNEARDAKDNKFLELALDGQASCIISGDADLLVLHPFRGIPILTPRDFLDG
jgi:uncharacterized protein